MSFRIDLSTDPVSDGYLEEPLVVAPEVTVEEVIQLFRAQRTASLLVCDDSGPLGPQLLGIFTERDALRWMASQEPMDVPITEAMTTTPVVLGKEATIGEAIRSMAAGDYRHVPIIDEHGKPVGMTVVKGIMHYLVDHFPETIYTLPPEPDSVPSEREGA